MPNINRVRNGGFEQSTPPSVAPFWTASGGAVTQTGGTQLLGDNNAFLPAGSSIEQTLLPLQVGEIYTFKAAMRTGALTGTIDVEISGKSTRHFQGFRVIGSTVYGFYNFEFTATDAITLLKITNNTESTVEIDTVSIKLA